MSKNSFGKNFCVTTFGESHGKALGVIIDGCPSEIPFDLNFLNRCLERRRPGEFGKKTDLVVSSRKEADDAEILSGIFNGKTLGTPIAIITRNTDHRSNDYLKIANKPRPGHADDLWKKKFGHYDYRGGGRASGRETVSRVMAGAVAQMYLKQVCPQLKINAFACQIGPYSLNNEREIDYSTIDQYLARFPDSSKEAEIQRLLIEGKKEGKSYGGKVRVIIENPPTGLGQPVFHKLKADFASALLGIGASCALEIGASDQILNSEGSILHTKDNPGYGGIRGGISTGEQINLEISFKPTSTVLENAKKGRHDPCIVPRAIPVVEAMVALVLADHFLWKQGDRVYN